MSRFRSRRTKLNTEFFESWEYGRYFWTDFDYSILKDHIMTRAKRGRGDHTPYNDVIIMADTETSKSPALVESQDPDFDIIRSCLLTRIRLPRNAEKEITDFKHWKKSCGITWSKEGISIDSIWPEWSSLYPWLFPEDITDQIDMLMHLSELYQRYGSHDQTVKDNHICLWTISLRAFHQNICTLYGNKPSDMITCITKLHDIMTGQRTIIYFHNLSYDWVFIRKFCFEKWGYPEKMLATKPHYPIYIHFENDINFKDSLILAQRSLERWSADLQVEHAKAVGAWDYNLIRNQNYNYSEQELHYAEFDTLAGVECLDTFMQSINRDLTSIPYTATGVVRNITREEGKKNNAHEAFQRQCIDSVELYYKAHNIYHGGYTHANRYIVGQLLTGDITCYDFASSYPFTLCAEKFVSEKFMYLGDNYNMKDVLDWYQDDYAILCTIRLKNVHLKNLKMPMPYIQQSKIIQIVNGIFDNGRVLDADELIIEVSEIDAFLIDRYYTYDNDHVSDLYLAKKDYLPRWFTDLVFQKYKEKCELKFGDPVLYNISKSVVNSLYGMCAQKSIMDEIQEDYITGEYRPVEKTREDIEKEYQKYLNKRGTILNYAWGLGVTGAATKNLFSLGECCRRWLYSDTDSCYGMDWDLEKIAAYNKEALQKLEQNGYGVIEIQGHTFQLGAAELDGTYKEFRTCGAKRYAVRNLDDSIKITVAGVPKKTGAKCLQSLDDFKKGFVFSGEVTGKKTHTMIFTDKIYTDDWGNEIGDSIDLSPCDYLLDATPTFDWWFDEVMGSFEIECYDEGRLI